LGIPVNRAKIVETTSYGVASLAGMTCGMWNSLDDLRKNWQSGHVFVPHMEDMIRERLYSQWKRAVLRSGKWIGPDLQ